MSFTPARKHRLRVLFTLALALVLTACATPPDDNPFPEPTSAERAGMQNECARIADRSRRQACLERAAFGTFRDGP